MNLLNTKYVGKVLLHFDELTSTNDYARILSNETSTLEGTVIMADQQSKGRGQLGAAWESAPGQNLTASIILRPIWLRADLQSGLSKAISLAVYDTILANTNVENSWIKWPNDLIINQKKVSGILIENTISGQNLSTAIVGIGINVNQTHFSPSLTQAGSLQQITGQTIDTAILAASLFEKIEYWYEILKKNGAEAIQTTYLQRLLGYQKERNFLLPKANTVFQGTIIDVDIEGRLCVETQEGIQRFLVKEIKYLDIVN
jgi:BirA family transcriptional regulator, biotin operon repressor / biotin---[acetyl-CoA-carboxylase] ligase